jgi:hypothetical protein
MHQAPEPPPSKPGGRADNGILARLPGQYIAQASRSLPDPACAIDDEICVEIDAACAGRVRLTFRKQRYSRPRRRTSYFAWLCRHAELVPLIGAPTPLRRCDHGGSVPG